jgi:tetratricopeptide (TPR) repeat protein
MMLGGCGTSDEGNGPTPPSTHVDRGWEAFEAGDFADAESHFEAAIAEDLANSEAHNGLGWTNMKLDDLQEALTSFDAALTHGFIGADPHAGKAILLRDLEPVDYAAAITSANSALGIESDYVFAHDADLDWKDLRLVLAQSHFALGAYDEANSQVGTLGGNEQDPASSTFVEDLLAEIERLGETIAG